MVKSRDIITYIFYITSCTRPIAINLASMHKVTYNHLNTWSVEVTWQIKNTSPLSQYLWSPNLSDFWHTVRNSYPEIHMIPQWDGLVKLPEKSNLLYFHLRKTHGYQTRCLKYCEKFPFLKPHHPIIKNFKNSYRYFRKTSGHGVDF